MSFWKRADRSPRRKVDQRLLVDCMNEAAEEWKRDGHTGRGIDQYKWVRIRAAEIYDERHRDPR